MLLALLPLSLAALRGVGLWNHDRGDQSDTSWNGVAASARASLETLIHGVEKEMSKCSATDSGCDDAQMKKQAAQLHRYKTALEELARIEKSDAVSELSKSQAALESVKATVTKLKTVVLGTELGAQSLVRQAQLIAEEQEHNAQDRDRATAALSDAEAKLSAAAEDADDKEQAAMLWATEVQSIARAAQLSDQYAEAMYASGVEKLSHAKAKEQRSEDLLKKAGTLADRIEDHLAPKPIVKEERLRENVGGSWGGAAPAEEPAEEPEEKEEEPEHALAAARRSASDDLWKDHEPAPELHKLHQFEEAEPAPRVQTRPEPSPAVGPAAHGSPTEERIRRWHAAAQTSAAPPTAVAPTPAVPASSGDEEMDDIDQEMADLGLPASA